MSRRRTQYYQGQFEQFRSDLERTWAISKKTFDPVESTLRGLHKRYLGIANLATIVGNRVDRADYIQTVPEVSYLALVLIVKGVQNPSLVMMRQCIELVVKHIYFASHPVEYGWSTTRDDFREIGFQYLMEYLRKTDEIQCFDEGPKLLVDLEREFHMLSRYVHVHNQSFTSFSNDALKGKAYTNALQAFEHRGREVWPILSVLLILFFPQTFLRASAAEQRLIKDSLPTNYRSIVKTHLRNLSIR